MSSNVSSPFWELWINNVEITGRARSCINSIEFDDLCDGSLSDKELKRRYHFNSTDRCLKSADGVEFFVSTQWMLKSIEKLIVVAKKYGMHCEKQIR